MYLDFITDIANVGDTIRITCINNEMFEGTIVKITPTIVAFKLRSGSLVIKKDEEICDLCLNPTDNTNNDVLDVKSNNETLHEGIINSEIEIMNSNTLTEEKQLLENTDITIGKYEKRWDSIDLEQLKKSVEAIKVSINLREKDTIVSSNATVREVIKRSFRVNADKLPRINVRTATIIERALLNDLKNFNIGDALPVVLYYHDYYDPNEVFLTLSPNTIGGYIEILESAIKEQHYKEAKSLCYFLLSQIEKGYARSAILALVRSLKPVNAFIKEKMESLNSPSKMPKDYKQIEKQLNVLIKEGKHSDAIRMIDDTLNNSNIDPKYKSSLLLRKAQAYSSINDYEQARLTYIELVSFKEATGGDPKNLSHLYTELARLQAVDKSGYDEARISAEKALKYNPQNKYADTLLEQIKTGNYSTVSASSRVLESTEENKELMLDSEDSALTISKMIEIDIREHHFTNEAIINNGGSPTAAIAKTIYNEAKETRDVDLSERYPVYLEAAKAYSELPVGSYDFQEYLESVAYYAVLKGNSLYVRFKKLLSEKNVGIGQLTHLKDSACSYYIESLNLLSSIESKSLLSILHNYLKMNIALANLKGGKEPNISGSFNRVFFNCLSSNNEYLNLIAWSTIIAVGTASPTAWNKLTTIKGGTGGLYSIMKNPNNRQRIYAILNKTNVSPINTLLLPGEFLKESFKLRTTRNKQLADVMAQVSKMDFNIHLLDPLLVQWEQIPNYIDLLNETEAESKAAVDKILQILKPYSNRSSIERTNLLIQVQSKIEEQLSFINDNTTYYGRAFFFPLLRKWKKTVANLLEKKIAETLPQLIIVADPPYIVNNDASKSVNLIIKNQGESTAEGFILVPEVMDMLSGESYNATKNYSNEIPAGNNYEINMNLPSSMLSAQSIKLSVSISAIYQGKELPPQLFKFTLEEEPQSSLSYEDIPWKDGPIPAEQMFKGRKGILNRLKKHYTSIERDKPYILYGLTRTGKSSILKYLGEALNRENILINGETYTIATFEWDFSQASSFGNAQDMWEYLLFDQFNEHLISYIGQDGYKQLNMPERPRAKELNNALQFLHSKRIYPMFLVDEFSYIKVMMDNNFVNPAFLHTLRQYSLAGLASFIYAGTYDIKALLKDSKYGITGQLVNAVEEQISEIDQQSAEELISVMGDKLRFTPDAVEHIHKLSGDVPYFVQMICKYCGFYAVENKRSIIGYPELEKIISILTGEREMTTNSMVKTLPENVFQNNMFSPADPIEVNVLISSIVFYNRENKENPRGVGVVELQELWAKKNIAAFRPKLAESIELLCQKKVLIQKEDEWLPVYIISVDLFRRWWAVHHTDIDLQLNKIL